MLVICVLTPVCAFFSLMLCIFLCARKNKSRPSNRRMAGFYDTGLNNTGIMDARQVGLSPAANYIPQQRKVPPPPPMARQQPTMPQRTNPQPQQFLNRTPHYVSRSRQQRL